MYSDLTLRKLKPGLVLNSNYRVIIIDVACPYDLYTEKSFFAKIARYKALRDVVSQFYKEDSVYPFVIGSTGLLHQKLLQFLMSCGMPKMQPKGLCKWMSNSSTMGARDIWSIRYRLVEEKSFSLLCLFF